MIDEELYRKAADELDSDHRRPHIWARACALANDDHDEARYLYTNLRVEELLSEEARATVAVANNGAEQSASLNDLELAPVDIPPLLEGDGQAVVSARSGIDASSTALTKSPDEPQTEGLIRPRSEHDKVTLELDENDTLDLDPVDVEHLNDPAAVALSSIHGGTLASGAAELDHDKVEQTDRTTANQNLSSPGDTPADAAPDADLTEDTTANPVDDTDLDNTGLDVSELGTSDDDPAADGVITSGYHDVENAPLEPAGADHETRENSIPTLFREADVDGESATGSLDDLGWLDEEYRAERRDLDHPASPVDDDPSDTFTRELERQAEDLPGGVGTSVIPHEDYSADDEPTGSASLADELAARTSGTASNDPSPEATTADTLASGDTLPTEADDGLGDDVQSAEAGVLLELADRRGRTAYAVYERPDSARRAVRQGGSWLAMLFTLPWLLIRGLFGTAIVYALLAAVILGGLLITGQAWLNAGDSATLATRVATIGFGLLAFVGLLVVPFARANHWREEKLERKGFARVARVRARSPRRALAVLEQYTHGTSGLHR